MQREMGERFLKILVFTSILQDSEVKIWRRRFGFGGFISSKPKVPRARVV